MMSFVKAFVIIVYWELVARPVTWKSDNAFLRIGAVVQAGQESRQKIK
jgi:hypothetical protein